MNLCSNDNIDCTYASASPNLRWRNASFRRDLCGTPASRGLLGHPETHLQLLLGPSCRGFNCILVRARKSCLLISSALEEEEMRQNPETRSPTFLRSIRQAILVLAPPSSPRTSFAATGLGPWASAGRQMCADGEADVRRRGGTVQRWR
jgi:hypothetical protein